MRDDHSSDLGIQRRIIARHDRIVVFFDRLIVAPRRIERPESPFVAAIGDAALLLSLIPAVAFGLALLRCLVGLLCHLSCLHPDSIARRVPLGDRARQFTGDSVVSYDRGMVSLNSFDTRMTLTAGGQTSQMFSLPRLEKRGFGGVARLPYSLKILLENLLRRE